MSDLTDLATYVHFTALLISELSFKFAVFYCATGGVDFRTTIQTAAFATGTTTSSVSISVFGDNFVEGDETFDLTLTVPELFNGRISAGSRGVAVGNITDTTSECDICMIIT